MIKKNANIGVGAILLPNVKIGEDSLVGAMAVVTRNVDKYERVMGISTHRKI